MTATRGMLWKTGWRRRTAYGDGQSAGLMWNIDLKGADNFYAMALANPQPFTTVPWWLGWAGVLPESNQVTISAGAGLDRVQMDVFVVGTPPRAQVTFIGQGLGVQIARSTTYLAKFTPGSTVVFMMTAIKENVASTDITIRIYMDTRLALAFVVPSYTAPPTTVFRVDGGGTSANIAGIAAGRGQFPTDDEIQQWFVDVRSNLEVGSIPGKTTDLFSAEVVAPLAPASWVNTGGGQNMAKTNTGAAATNTQLPAIFNY